jgi:hypothetical protein
MKPGDFINGEHVVEVRYGWRDQAGVECVLSFNGRRGA